MIFTETIFSTLVLVSNVFVKEAYAEYHKDPTNCLLALRYRRTDGSDF